MVNVDSDTPSPSLTDFLKKAGLEGEHWSALLIDVDSVQRYVLESPRLPEIRGASILLAETERDLFGETGEWLTNGKLQPVKHDGLEMFPVYAAGGTALILVPEETAGSTERAQEALRSIRREYGERLGTVNLSGATLAVDDALYPPAGEPQTARPEDAWYRELNPFQKVMRHLVAGLRRAKDQPDYVAFFPLEPLERPADTVPVRPATERVPVSPAEERFGDPEKGYKFLDWVSYQKDENRRGNKGRLLESFVSYYRNKRNLDEEDLSKLDPPTDLAHIRELYQDKEHPYVGLVYFDGNSIGSLLERCQSPADYARLSRGLAASTQEAVSQALFETVNRLEKDKGKQLLNFNTLPFEVVVIGGDDVLAFCPAGVVPFLAARLCQLFNEACLANEDLASLSFKLDKPLTGSAGCVVSGSKHSVLYLERLARQALDRAKRAGRASAHGSVYFELVDNDRTSLRPEDSLEGSKGQGQDKWRLTEFPATPALTLERLEQARRLRACDDFGATTLSHWSARLSGGLSVHVSNAFTRKVRQKRSSERILIKMLEQEQISLSSETLPWYLKDGIWITPVLDLSALYRLMPHKVKA